MALSEFDDTFSSTQINIYNPAENVSLVSEVEGQLPDHLVISRSQYPTIDPKLTTKNLVEKDMKRVLELSQAQSIELVRVDEIEEVNELWREAAELEPPNHAIDRLIEISVYSESVSAVKLAGKALADLQWQQDLKSAANQQQNSGEMLQIRWKQALQEMHYVLIGGSDPGQRAHALQFLVSSSLEDPVELIEFANSDPDPTVRLAAIQAVWRLIADGQDNGNERILSVVQQASADQNSLVASTASNALSDLKQFGLLTVE